MEVELFWDESHQAFARFTATLRIALDSCKTVSNSNANSELLSEIVGHLDGKRSKAVIEVMRGTADALLEATRHPQKNGRLSIHVDTAEIADVEIRAAVEAIHNRAVAFCAPVSGINYIAQAATVAIVSAFEIYLSQLLTNFYRMHPAAIPGNPQISLSEAMEANSIEEAVSRIASKYVHSLTEMPFEDWVARLTQHAGISLGSRPANWPRNWRFLGQTAAIRNSLVHTGGKVDDKFRRLVSKFGFTLPPNCASFSVNAEHVTKSVGEYLACASRIFYGLMSKQLGDLASHKDIRMREFLASQLWNFIDHGHPEAIGSFTNDVDTYFETDREIDSLGMAILAAVYVSGDKERASNLCQSIEWPDSSVFQIFRASICSDALSLLELAKAAIRSKDVGVIEVMYAPQLLIVRERVDVSALKSLIGEPDDRYDVSNVVRISKFSARATQEWK